MAESLITDAMVAEFKAHMHITHSREDPYLRGLLETSAAAVMAITNDNDLTDKRVIELVYQRARYAYNDQLEWFDANFRSMLMNLAIEHYEGVPDQDNE